MGKVYIYARYFVGKVYICAVLEIGKVYGFVSKDKSVY